MIFIILTKLSEADDSCIITVSTKMSISKWGTKPAVSQFGVVESTPWIINPHSPCSRTKNCCYSQGSGTYASEITQLIMTILHGDYLTEDNADGGGVGMYLQSRELITYKL